MLRQDTQDISRLRASNVPEPEWALKRKVQMFCAEAVEDGTLLWKDQEKAGRDNGHFRLWSKKGWNDEDFFATWPEEMPRHEATEGAIARAQLPSIFFRVLLFQKSKA